MLKKDNFIDDLEKMRDFMILTKEEFLESYSYLTEAEYDNTAEIACVTWPVHIIVNGGLEYSARLTPDKISALLKDADGLERNEAYDLV